MRYATATHKGLKREINEDYHKVIIPVHGSEQPVVFVVADGMGGHNSGEVASRMAVEYAGELLTQYGKETGEWGKLPDVIREIIEDTNTKIYEKASTEIEHLGMGTTITMSAFLGDRIVTGHVGDSRLYLLRDGDLQRITNDHSLIEELVRNGTITRDEAYNHPNRNIITKALGCERELQADIYETNVKEGDKLLICTDGLTNMVDEKEILSVLASKEDPEKACCSLIEMAINNGGFDNITVIVAYV